STLLLDARYIRDAVSQRLNDDCHGSNEVAEQTSENPAHCSGKLWMQAYGNWSYLDGSQGTARIDHDISGFFLGGDKTFNNRLTLGVIAGYGHSTSDVHERDSRDKADHFHLGGYMGYRQGAFALKAGLSHSEHRSDSRRHVNIRGFHDTLTARPHARTTQIFTELAYDVDMRGFTLTPFVR